MLGDETSGGESDRRVVGDAGNVPSSPSKSSSLTMSVKLVSMGGRPPVLTAKFMRGS